MTNSKRIERPRVMKPRGPSGCGGPKPKKENARLIGKTLNHMLNEAIDPMIRLEKIFLR